MAKKRRGWVGVFAFGLALAVGVVWPTPARAINIVIQLQNEGENPSWDASGSQLQAAFNAAAQVWERLLPGGGTYEVDVWWEDLDDGTLGQWSPECCGDNNIRIDPTPKTSGGDNFTWWVDPTPLENSEFDFTNGSNYQGITLYEDLTGSQQNNWFIGPVPAVLEVGYRGFANASGPSGSNQLDLLSTLIHELGHELGVNGEFDGEMELNASHVGGANGVAALEDSEGGHLAVEASLMCAGCGSANLRRLPSAVDVLAAAEDQGISSVDLKRKHFISGSSWGSASNWIGGRVPDINDEVFIVHGGNVSLTSSSPTDMQSLVIDQQSQVSTGSRHMRVATSVLIEGGNSKLVIGSGGLFENTSIQSGVTLETGVIDLDGGTARISFLTSNTGHVEGHGTFELLHNFQNNGTVSAEDNGTLNITGSILLPADKLDLDGDGPAESGSVKAINGNIRIFHPMPEDDPFDGFMQIGAGRSILVGPWTLGAGGVLLLDGSPTQDATLGENSFSPRDHELYGIVIVDGRGVVNPTSVRFNSTSNIQMPGSEDILILNSPDTAFTGGTYLGNGVLRQGGDFTVESDTAFNMNTFDWGNSTSTQDNLLRVYSGATLTINSTGSGTSGNPYRGRITLDSGVLDVGFTNGWTLASADRSLPDGTMLIRNFGGPTPEIKGERITVDSFMEVVGGLAIVSADLTTTANADIYVHAGGTLQLFGYSIFNQGYFNTAPGETGTIRQSGNIDVVGDVYMDVATYDWGNGYRVNGINVSHRTLIGQDVLFAVRAASTGTAGNPYHGDLVILGGQLHTEFDNPWTLPAATGNLLSGAPRGVITFSYNFFTFEHTTGLITGQEFNVGGDINVLENPLNPNSAEIHANVTFLDTAAVNLASNTDLSLFGTTTFLGGSFTGAGTLAQGANFTVNADTTIDVQEFDWGNSLSALNMRQLLVNNGATFTINSQDLGDPDAKFRGILRLHGGHLTVNTPGGWLIPSGTAIGPPAGLLELQTVNGINPTVNGTLLTVAGKLTVDDAPSTTAIINADVSLLSNSTIDIGPGATLDLRGSNLYQNAINFTGAGTLRHSGSGFYGINDLDPAHFEQNGTMTVFNPSTTPRFAATTTRFTGLSTTSLVSNLLLAGDVTIDPGATFTGGGSLIIETGATLGGGGDIGVDLINNGTLSPGDTASLFAIDGDYTQDNNASLIIDLYNDSGPAGAGFDALDVTGTATLQGVLNVLTVGAFMPSPGDTFQIITASTISSTFASIFAPNLAPNLTLNLLYATDSVTLQVISTLPGDLNGDGFVGIADLNIILSNWNQNVPPADPAADPSGDNFVGILDLNTVLGNWNAGTPPTEQNVPEPAGLFALALAASAMRRTR